MPNTTGPPESQPDRQAEQLGQAEHRDLDRMVRQIADALPQIAWTTRPDGFIDYFNARWYEFTGFNRTEADPQGWESILHPGDLQRSVDTYVGCIKAERPCEIEYRFKDRSTGGYRWFLGRAMPLQDEQGRVIRWFVTCTDIDDTKLNEMMRETDRRKDEFLATLAHELRNPLAPLRNALQIMKLTGDGEGAAQVREMMERQVHQMVRIVDDLLDVSRITRGKIELRKERVALATVVETAKETSRPLIEGAHHELIVTFPPEPVLVNGDHSRLAQVVSNLLNNAAKYTPEGGRIWLTVERGNAEAVIHVRDSGTGIPADMLARIWEMFTQVDRTLERAQGGLGIGLTLVRRLVEMHGGTVEAFSEGVGRGSTFTVRLPLDQTQPRPQETGDQPGEGQPAPPLGRCRILVVDDNVDSARSLAMLLQLAGNDVRMVHDGPSALEVAAAFVPDVVLLDIGLPGMNGLDVARKMREMPRLKDAMLIAQTGWGQQEDRCRTEEAGFNAHLVKPVDLAALQAMLAGLPKKLGG